MTVTAQDRGEVIFFASRHRLPRTDSGAVSGTWVDI